MSSFTIYPECSHWFSGTLAPSVSDVGYVDALRFFVMSSAPAPPVGCSSPSSSSSGSSPSAIIVGWRSGSFVGVMIGGDSGSGWRWRQRCASYGSDDRFQRVSQHRYGVGGRVVSGTCIFDTFISPIYPSLFVNPFHFFCYDLMILTTQTI